MRLFVKCPVSNNKLYLESGKYSRQSLPLEFTIKCPYDNSIHSYQRNDIIAEPEGGASIGAAILGGIVGLIGGPLGLIAGGLIGAVIGNKIEQSDDALSQEFNRDTP